MMRPSVIVVTLSMLAACGGLAYLHTTRERAGEEPAASSGATRTQAAVEYSAPATSTPSEALASADATTLAVPTTEGSMMSKTAAPGRNIVAAPETVAQWIKDTDSTDAAARAAAIASLADAPIAQAMPALERVLESGEPTVDRHIALRSLHSLALRDGDTNGQIRDVMRSALYHGDDDAVTQTAQSLLDDIEADFSERKQN